MCARCMEFSGDFGDHNRHGVRRLPAPRLRAPRLCAPRPPCSSPPCSSPPFSLPLFPSPPFSSLPCSSRLCVVLCIVAGCAAPMGASRSPQWGFQIAPMGAQMVCQMPYLGFDCFLTTVNEQLLPCLTVNDKSPRAFSRYRRRTASCI